MDLLTYLQIFSSFWCSTFLALFPGTLQYKQFALGTAIISAISIMVLITRKGIKIPKSTLYWFIASFILLTLYYITPYFYNGGTNDKYNSFLLVLLGQVFPAVLTASLIGYYTDIQMKIKRVAPFVALIFTLLSITSVVFPTSVTTGGYVDNENGLDYQSASYLAAYASGLAEYYLLTYKNEYNYKFMQTKIVRAIVSFSILIDFIAILFSGGRGGFVAFVILLTISIVMAIPKGAVEKSEIIKSLCLLVIVVFAGYISIRYVSNSSVSTSGYYRLISFLESANDSGRAYMRDIAIDSFLKSPAWGHGVGSVFYEMGYYSHNLFTDAMVETGIIGTIVYACIIVKTISRCINQLRNDKSESLWLYLFLFGFIMSLFSGYYLAHIPMFWAIAYILSIPNMSTQKGRHG